MTSPLSPADKPAIRWANEIRAVLDGKRVEYRYHGSNDPWHPSPWSGEAAIIKMLTTPPLHLEWRIAPDPVTKEQALEALVDLQNAYQLLQRDEVATLRRYIEEQP